MTEALQTVAVPTGLPETVFAIFSAQIDQQSVQRVINGMTIAMAQGVKTVHLLFQSGGGYISDGICLYNFFKALTLDVTIYNGGGVSSMAAIAFLGIPKRKASKYGTFMIHRSHCTLQNATASKLEEAAVSLRIDDKRTEAILRDHISLTEEQWNKLNFNELTFTAEEAVNRGFAQVIAEFEPPPGARIFTV